jgi:hypothetical protein
LCYDNLDKNIKLVNDSEIYQLNFNVITRHIKIVFTSFFLLTVLNSFSQIITYRNELGGGWIHFSHEEYIEGTRYLHNDISLGVPVKRIFENQKVTLDSIKRNHIIPVMQLTILKNEDKEANKQVRKLNKMTRK